MDQIYYGAGVAFDSLELRETPPSAEEILTRVLGRSGTLRAPTIRLGRTLLVGYSEALYTKILLCGP